MLTPIDFILNDPESTESYFEVYSRDNEPSAYKTSVYGIKNDYATNDLSFYYKSLNKILNIYSNFSDSLILPGLRYFGDGLLVFERPPTHKHISFVPTYRDQINDDPEYKEYFLPIPWQVYIAKYNPQDMRLLSVSMFFADSSLYDSGQTLYAPPLLNFYGNGGLCRPFFASIEDVEKYPQDLSGVMASAYDWIWNSGFNYDITHNISEFLVSKNYELMYSLIPDNLKTVKIKAVYNWLVSSQMSYSPANLSGSYVTNFYYLWQQVPLQDITNVKWCSPISADFNYLEFDHLKETLAEQWANDNGYEINWDSEEDEDDYDPDYHISIYTIYDMEDFHHYINNYIRTRQLSLQHFMIDGYGWLLRNKVLKNYTHPLQALHAMRDSNISKEIISSYSNIISA